MKRLVFLCFIVFLIMISTFASDTRLMEIKQQPITVKKNISPLLIPLYFIPNRGQVNQNVQFYARTSGYTLWLTREGLVFDSVKKVEGSGRDVSRLMFLGSHKNPELVPLEITGHRVNYFKGKAPSQWTTGIKTAKAVLYKSLYKDIHLKVYGIEKQIEYDWIVKPGGDPNHIRFRYQNVKGTRIDEKGNLVIETRFGELIHRRPVSYQEIEGKRVTVNVAFKKLSTNDYGFRVGSYDTDRELVIDPVVLVYSTYLGGSNNDHIFALAVDNSGCAYITGNTFSTNFPTEDAYQNSLGGGIRDSFLVKFSSSGSDLVYSTYFGGSGNDTGEAIQVDSSNRAYVVGYTDSTDFPTQGAYQNTYSGGDEDVTVTIFSSTGASLVYSSYLGGDGMDEAFALALDSSKNMYITGHTSSTNFPTVNAYRDTFTPSGQNEYDVFVTKMASSGSSLVYSTYLGGNGKETGYGIAVNGSNAYITGLTYSTNFPLKNEYQSSYGGGDKDGFLTKLSSAGNSLIYSTYLGGSGNDSAWGIAVDSSGRAHVTGDTYSTDFPTMNAYQNTHAGGGRDAFLTKFATSGTTLKYSTYLGGTESDAAAHVVLNSSGYAFITGYTSSSDFPTRRAYQSTYNGDLDAMVAMFTPEGSNLAFSSFLGGSDLDTSRAIALDNSGNIYLAGFTESTDFPTENAYQNTGAGNEDAFVTKLSTSQFGTLCGAVDNCNLTWTTGGDADWFEQTDTYYYDDDAAQSGALSGASEASYIQTTVTGPGELSFWWKVSSSSWASTFKFYLDGQSQDSIYGNGGSWQHETYSIAEGSHTLKWSYEKIYSYSYYSDCGWLDKVEYTQETSIELDRTQLTFGAVQGGDTTGVQTFSISNPTGGALNWTVTVDKNWIGVTPISGTSGGVVDVSVYATGLSAGVHSGTITISAANASNSPRTVSVILNVYKPGHSSAPFGTYETPTNNSTIMSSVPFTGWVLDDMGMQSVKIYRKSGGSKIYIGDGVFVEGARPDVEQAFPDYPYNYKAGWGYMMLTNFLPNGGNGTFSIEAIATDIEGHQVSLGTKTVTVDNASAVKPFGALDTPTQGGTASGSGYINWGWVLTPQPNSIDIDGSTIKVWVDGVNIGHPTYNIYRSDIASLFPGYANSNGAAGYLKIDTTAYDNGVHTIQWTATDSGNNTDGIGSRYFTIQNSSTQSTTGSVQSVPPGAHRPRLITPGQDFVLDTSTPVGMIKGYNTGPEPMEIEMISPDEQGMITIEARELDRVELRFGDEGQVRKLSGWLVVGDQFRPLPPGTKLNPDTGTFCWQIGMAYVGRYRLFFIEEDQYGNQTGRYVSVNISSKF
ncbi:MAG: SBBP repeat-containing protein [Candidatus Aminicenantes bacterium]|jgi:hypothetical protein